MRAAIVILSCILLLELLFLPAASGGLAPAGQLSLAFHSALYTRSLEVAGSVALSPNEIKSLLPHERSNFFWRIHDRELELELKRNPLVEDALIEPCSFMSLRCFKVRVEERHPAYLIRVSTTPWLVGRDGTFIVPAPDKTKNPDLKQFLSRHSASLVKVEGAMVQEASPDVVRGRLRYVRDAIDVIQSEVGKRIQNVTVKDSGELEVVFRGLKFPVIFGFSGGDFSLLGQEARRLSLLLTKLVHRESVIRTIDMAFNKVAVVRLID